MKKFRHCVVHIGLQKTGTTTIQAFLASNRAKLAQEGVLYPKFTGEFGGGQSAFVAYATKCPWDHWVGARLGIRTKEDKDHHDRLFLSALDQEIRAQEERKLLVVSSEHFHSDVAEYEDIQKLRDLLSRYASSISVLMYIRRQDEVACGQYVSTIKTGENPAFVFAPEGAPEYTEYYYDYDAIYRNWRAAFGLENVVVRLYQREELYENDLLQDFAKSCAFSYAGKHVPANENVSLTNIGVALLREVNVSLPWQINGRLNHTRERIRIEVEQLCCGRPSLATSAAAKAFVQRYEESNATLWREAFPGRLAPIFRDDYSGYPDECERCEVTTADLMPIISSILTRVASPGEVVLAAYEALLGRQPDPQGMSAWLEHINDECLNASQFLARFMESEEFCATMVEFLKARGKLPLASGL